MSTIVEALAARAGRYAGEGINHDQEPFRGELTLTPVADGAAIAIDYTATGLGEQAGTVFHTEHSVIATDATGAPLLATVNAHGGGLQSMPLRRDAPEDGSERTLVFGFNDPADTAAFRMEIAIDLWPNGDLTYRHAWGLPGGSFAPRSGARLAPGD